MDALLEDVRGLVLIDLVGREIKTGFFGTGEIRRLAEADWGGKKGRESRPADHDGQVVDDADLR